MVLDMFMADRDAVWRFWQAAIGESQCRPLVFWSMTLLSSTDSYSSFEKQLFTCCWSLVETKHLIMGHQVTMWLTLLIMNWALPDPPCHKVGCAHDAVKMVCTWSDPSNPGGTITRKNGSNIHGPHSCYIAFCFPALTYGLMGSFLWLAERGSSDLGLMYRCFWLVFGTIWRLTVAAP